MPTCLCTRHAVVDVVAVRGKVVALGKAREGGAGGAGEGCLPDSGAPHGRLTAASCTTQCSPPRQLHANAAPLRLKLHIK